jgi:replicative DNA helicase
VSQAVALPVGRDDGVERMPPWDLGAEQCVLGGMLMSKAAVGDVLETALESRDFYRPAHQLVHEAILGLYGQGLPADTVTVADELTKRGEIARAGGAPYLHTLLAAVPVAGNAGYYARIVRDKALLRRMIEAGTRIVQLGYSEAGEAGELLERGRGELAGVAGLVSGGNLRLIADDIGPALDPVRLAGIPTGFADLDALTGGLLPGQMVIVAGRPGMGKSTLLLDIARHASIRSGHRAAVFSLEMSRSEVIGRVICAQSRVPYMHLRDAALSEDDITRITRKLPDIQDAPLHVDDTPLMSMMQIRAELTRMQLRGEPADLVCIDYVQLVQGSGRKSDNRQQEVSDISRGTKLMAKDFGVPVIMAAQLNRGPEARADHKPFLSDLRESGALEQDADLVLLLHREDAYEPESPRAGEADFIVAKHRNGPTGVITVAFQGHYSRFSDMARV